MINMRASRTFFEWKKFLTILWIVITEDVQGFDNFDTKRPESKKCEHVEDLLLCWYEKKIIIKLL
jgi:hypothetical protein